MPWEAALESVWVPSFVGCEGCGIAGVRRWMLDGAGTYELI